MKDAAKIERHITLNILWRWSAWSSPALWLSLVGDRDKEDRRGRTQRQWTRTQTQDGWRWKLTIFNKIHFICRRLLVRVKAYFHCFTVSTTQSASSLSGPFSSLGCCHQTSVDQLETGLYSHLCIHFQGLLSRRHICRLALLWTDVEHMFSVLRGRLQQ